MKPADPVEPADPVRTTFQLDPQAVAAAAAAPSVPTSGTTDIDSRPQLGYVIGGLVAVAVFWAIAAFAIKDSSFPPKVGGAGTAPVAGLTIFAVFFVAAQAIERLLEPIASYFFDAQATQDATAAAAKAVDAHAEAAEAVAVTANDADARQQVATTALNDAAESKARAARAKANRKILFWAIASSVSVLASSSLKLYFLRAVGIAAPPRALDILATGLIIGGGTAPLHDLVTLISAKAAAAKAS